MTQDFRDSHVNSITDANIVVIDCHDFRRSAISDFILKWMDGHDVSIFETPSMQALLSGNTLKEMAPNLLALVLSIGGACLSDPKILREIIEIKKSGEGWPLIIIADDASDMQVRLAMEIGASGIIPTTMSSGQALSTFEFIMNGGRFFPNGRTKWPPQHSATAASPSAVENIDRGPPCSAGQGGKRLTFRKKPDRSDVAPLYEAFTSKTTSRETPTPETSSTDAVDGLTQRQIEVLKALVPGLSNKQIARKLSLSDATVKVHIRNLMKKLGANNRTQLALIGFKYIENQSQAQN